MSAIVSLAERKRSAGRVALDNAREAVKREQVRGADNRKPRDPYFQRDGLPDVKDCVSAAAGRAAEAGHEEVLVATFPGSRVSDKEPFIDKFESDWWVSGEGAAERAHHSSAPQLQPVSRKMRAEVLTDPVACLAMSYSVCVGSTPAVYEAGRSRQ